MSLIKVLAGQERYDSLAPIYYRGGVFIVRLIKTSTLLKHTILAHAAIVAYDITDQVVIT